MSVGNSQVVLMVKNPPANAGVIRVWSLGWEDPLGKGMATHSSWLAGWIFLGSELFWLSGEADVIKGKMLLLPISERLLSLCSSAC